jgi:uncharacterized protein YjdB
MDPNLEILDFLTEVYVDNGGFAFQVSSDNPSGAYSYLSSDTNVANVYGSHVTIVGVGSTDIKVEQQASDGYAAGSATATLIVLPTPTTITLSDIPNSSNVSAIFMIFASSNSTMLFIATSSDTSVATVDSIGLVTCVGVGTVTITVSQYAGNGYEAGSATATLNVLPKDNPNPDPTPTSITLSNIPSHIHVKEKFNIGATSNSPQPFLYSSSDTSVATVSSTGEVTGVDPGDVTITVSQAATSKYTEASVMFQLNVNKIQTVLEIKNFPVVVPANYGTFELDVVSNNNMGNFYYSNGDNTVATVKDKLVTIVGPGSTFIFIHQDSSDQYTSAVTSVNIIVNQTSLQWIKSNPVPTGFNNAWSSVTCGAGKFVAVASAGTSKRIAMCDVFSRSSAFGKWELIEAPANNEWRSVIYGNGLFVAVASAGSKRVMTSADGLNWQLKNFPDREWYSVAYGQTQFVVVGNNCIMKISADGTSYTMIDSPSDSDWRSVIYGNGLFVAVARSGSNRVMKSSDGNTWNPVNSPVLELYSVTYGQGKFIAVGNNCRMTSTDATSWTSTTFDNANWRSITYTGNAFIAVGINCAKYSTNGSTWSLVLYQSDYTANYNVNWSCVAYGAPRVGFARFIAVSSSGTVGGNIMSKRIENSISYTMGQSDRFKWYSVTYGKDMFVATSYYSSSNSQTIMTSPNGTDWTFRTTPGLNCFGVCYGNNLFVAVSSGVSTVYQNGEYMNTQVMTSSNGIDWTCQPLPDGDEGYYYWFSVCYGNGLFVAVASNVNDTVDGKRIMTSPDGIQWTLRNSPANNSWMSVCYGNNLFVAVAYDGLQRVMTSSDGINWSLRTSGDDTMSWNKICYGDKFVAVADSSSDDPTKKTIMTSTDGVHWTMRESADNSMSLNTVCYGNNTYLALAYIGSGQYAMTSSNGIDWVSKDCPMTAWGDVVYGNGRFVGVSQLDNAAIASLPITPTLSNFSFTPTKIGIKQIKITPPTSNSKGPFTYTSSNPNVAVIVPQISGGGKGGGKEGAGGGGKEGAGGGGKGGAAGGAAAGGAAGGAVAEAAAGGAAAGGAVAEAAAGGAAEAAAGGAAGGAAAAGAGGAVEVPAEGAGGAGGATTYVINLIAPGTTTITATQAAQDDYGQASITAELVVTSDVIVNLDPQLRNFTIPSKPIGTHPFNVTRPTSNSSGKITYTSSDTSIATITENGLLKIVNKGTCTIRADQEASDPYTSGHITTDFTVTPASADNPVPVQSKEALRFALTTSARYIALTESIVL